MKNHFWKMIIQKWLRYRLPMEFHIRQPTVNCQLLTTLIYWKQKLRLWYYKWQAKTVHIFTIFFLSSKGEGLQFARVHIFLRCNSQWVCVFYVYFCNLILISQNSGKLWVDQEGGREVGNSNSQAPHVDRGISIFRNDK